METSNSRIWFVIILNKHHFRELIPPLDAMHFSTLGLFLQSLKPLQIKVWNVRHLNHYGSSGWLLHIEETLEVESSGLNFVFKCTSFLIEVEFISNNDSNSCILLCALPFLTNLPPQACFLPSNSVTQLSVYMNHMAAQRDVSHPTDTSLWLANPSHLNSRL